MVTHDEYLPADDLYIMGSGIIVMLCCVIVVRNHISSLYAS